MPEPQRAGPPGPRRPSEPAGRGMTELILWRHGQTDHNLVGRVQGQVDIPLNATGLAQAAAAARILASPRPDRIVSSPLSRARTTAQILADLTGLDIEVEADLTERSFGVWEGLDRAAMMDGWPEQYAVWRDGGQPEGVGVEPRIDVARRVGTALERIASRTGEGRVVVVAHGSALTLGATLLLGLDPTAWFGLRGMDNCHYAVLRDSERAPGWLVRTWNKGDAAPVGE
jgi:hypothetical protein